MKKIIGIIVLFLLVNVSFAKQKHYQMNSPNGKLKVDFKEEQGKIYYAVHFQDQLVVDFSQLGLEFKDQNWNFSEELKITKVTTRELDEKWSPVWGENEKVRNHYKEFTYILKKKDKRLKIAFRLFNDGIAFRYFIPEQKGFASFELMNELTQFKMNAEDKAWWIPAYQKNSYEHLYQCNALAEIKDTIHTPLTIETKNGLYVSIHEANLTDFASMCVAVNSNGELESDLAPWPNGVKVVGKNQMRSPWRVILVGDKLAQLANSNTVLNLNPSCKIDDTSWIKTGKYVGVWWEMHLKKSTWKQGDKHGANTENVKKYIDFAADNGFSGVLTEGWNFGWDGKWYQDGSNFKFSKPVPAFDMDELSKYAKEKGVQLIGHHETGGDVKNYLKQVEEAFQYCNKHNISVVKTGHVGQFLNGKHSHYGQFAVNYYRRIVRLAAKYQICIDVHEPVKATGIRRTWPNMMTREGARGMEFDAWSRDGGNPPNHLEILPFTRCLAGPFDFTPGIFEMELKSRPKNQSNMTLAKQLAAYVIIYSPLHMAADLPENYKGNPAFQFVKDVPVDWKHSQFLACKIGKFCAVARQDKNSEDWYLGYSTNEKARKYKQKLNFLPKGKYIAEIYRDGEDAHWKKNPKAIVIEQVKVTHRSTLEFKVAAGGGVAVRFRKL